MTIITRRAAGPRGEATSLGASVKYIKGWPLSHGPRGDFFTFFTVVIFTATSHTAFPWAIRGPPLHAPAVSFCDGPPDQLTPDEFVDVVARHAGRLDQDDAAARYNLADALDDADEFREHLRLERYTSTLVDYARARLPASSRPTRG
jgi:hypothetical protein